MNAILRKTVIVAAALLIPVAATPKDWPSWRGPEQRGLSRDTKLPEKVALTEDGKPGEGFLWSFPEGGRSSPVVLDGHVYVLNNAGSGVNEQERLLCLDKETGKRLWEHRFNIFLTDISSNRVGWSNPVADPETGYVYAHGVQNTFVCLDRSGNVVWQRSMHEEYGCIMGYGGRTHTPVVDEDLVIVSFLNSSWGSQGPGRHRYVAFDKRTGAAVWWSTPGGRPLDTTYSTPVVAVVNGQRVLIGGNADGSIYAMRVRTGEKVWGFRLSKRGINVSVVEHNGKVFVSHSEENLDSVKMGRIVCIDATGQGDVTETHEVWRMDGITAGYSSPALHDGKLYLFENSANLLCINAETGKLLWKYNVGTVMKGSPVVADGKIYVCEVNSRFAILKLGEDSCETISEVIFSRPDGTVVELNGCPAIAGGRVYFTTRDGIYCVGEKEWKGEAGAVPPMPEEDAATAQDAPAHLQVTPADVVLSPGGSAVFKANLFDAKGRFLGTCVPQWVVSGLQGEVSESGKLTIEKENAFQQGTLTATLEKLTAIARVRIVPRLQFEVSFDDTSEGKPPIGWVGAGVKFVGATKEEDKALLKVGKNARFMDAETFFGLSTWENYTLQTDVYGTETRRNMPNVGIINSRYSFILMGNTQRLRLVSWIPQPRIDKTIKFRWDPDTWYTMKLRVAVGEDKAVVQGKVWPRSSEEPEAWTVEFEDPTPNRSGSPALHGYSAGITSRSPGAQIYYDNVKVYRNEN